MNDIDVRTQRVYDVVDDDGPATGEYRVLVDRLWPRGVKKERLVLDSWDKDVAPSSSLRQGWHHGELDDQGFADGYRRELEAGDSVVALCEAAESAHASTITLLYAAKDTQNNHALILCDAVRDALRAQG